MVHLLADSLLVLASCLAKVLLAVGQLGTSQPVEGQSQVAVDLTSLPVVLANEKVVLQES